MGNVSIHYQPPGLPWMGTIAMVTLLLVTTVGQVIMKGNVPIFYQPQTYHGTKMGTFLFEIGVQAITVGIVPIHY